MLTEPRALTDAQITQFEADGFVRLDHAFDPETARECRDILWAASGCDPHDPSTWTQPAIRLGMFTAPPFVAAANTPRLHSAFDALVGPGRWLPCGSVGTFRIAFPGGVDPPDAGWHIDVSFGTESPDFLDWRANVTSRGRALLLLMLFSDVGDDDAPTRLRRGSHLQIARQLAPAGDAGLTLRELAANGFEESADCPEALATGPAGAVYLCHPFIVHAAQPHHGSTPRFLAQPPILPRDPLSIAPNEARSPVERAIAAAVSAAPGR